MNAVKVLRSIPPLFKFSLSQPPYLYVLTAENQKTVTARVQCIKSVSNVSPRDLSYTLLRRQLQHYVSYGIGEHPSTTHFTDPVAVTAVRISQFPTFLLEVNLALYNTEKPPNLGICRPRSSTPRNGPPTLCTISCIP